jgi:hypothetical protein
MGVDVMVCWEKPVNLVEIKSSKVDAGNQTEGGTLAGDSFFGNFGHHRRRVRSAAVIR